VNGLRLAPLALAALLLGGCGSDGDSEQIRALVKREAAAAKAKNWSGICDGMSARLQAQLTAPAKLFGVKGKDCATRMKALAALDEDPEPVRDPGRITVTDIEVHGDRATARLGPAAPGEDPIQHFVREHGEWKGDVGPVSEQVDAQAPARSSGLGRIIAPKLRVAEQGFSRTTAGLTLYGAVIRNASASDAVGVTVAITLRAADGSVLDRTTESLEGIPARGAADVGGDAKPAHGRVATVEIAAKARSGAPSGTIKPPTVSGVRVFRNARGVQVSVGVTNTRDETMTAFAPVFAVLRDAAGRIVGGLSGTPGNDILPGRHGRLTIGSLGDVSRVTSAHVTADWDQGIIGATGG